jgi:hypothetical protein
MGRLVVVQQAMSDRAAAGVDGAPTATGGPVPVNEGENQWPPPPPGLASPQVHSQPHGQARQAEAVRNQIPMLHQLATPAAAATAALRPGILFPIPSAAAATTSTPARAANPFTFTARATGSRCRRSHRYNRYSNTIWACRRPRRCNRYISSKQAHRTVQVPDGHTDQGRVLATSQTPQMARHNYHRPTAAGGIDRSREMAAPGS